LAVPEGPAADNSDTATLTIEPDVPEQPDAQYAADSQEPEQAARAPGVELVAAAAAGGSEPARKTPEAGFKSIPQGFTATLESVR